MIDRVGQLWDLGEDLEWKHIATKSTPSRYRILVTESIDMGNGRTRQKFVYIKNGQRDASGDDTEYADLPWEHRKERTRVA